MPIPTPGGVPDPGAVDLYRPPRSIFFEVSDRSDTRESAWVTKITGLYKVCQCIQSTSCGLGMDFGCRRVGKRGRKGGKKRKKSRLVPASYGRITPGQWSAQWGTARVFRVPGGEDRRMGEVADWIKPGGKYRTRGGSEHEVGWTDMPGARPVFVRDPRGAVSWLRADGTVNGPDNPHRDDLMRPVEVSDAAVEAFHRASRAAFPDGETLSLAAIDSLYKAGLAAAFAVFLAEREGGR